MPSRTYRFNCRSKRQSANNTPADKRHNWLVLAFANVCFGERQMTYKGSTLVVHIFRKRTFGSGEKLPRARNLVLSVQLPLA